MYTVMGLDLSISSTGLVVIKGDKLMLSMTTANRKDLKIIERVLLINSAVERVILDYPPKLVVIEGLSYGSHSGMAVERSYLHWRLKEMLECHGFNYVDVPPKSLKKFATGTGLADKKMVISSVRDRWGVSFKDHNQSDAYVLSRIGNILVGYDDYNNLDKPSKQVIDSIRKRGVAF